MKSVILVNAVEPFRRALLVKHILFSPMLKILIAVSFLGVSISLSWRQCPKLGRRDGFVTRLCLPLLPNVSVLEAMTAIILILIYSDFFFFWMQPTHAVKNLPTINTNHLLLLLKTLPCVGCCHGWDTESIWTADVALSGTSLLGWKRTKNSVYLLLARSEFITNNTTVLLENNQIHATNPPLLK